MRGTLRAFFDKFNEELSSDRFRGAFEVLQAAHPEIAGFRTPRDLVAHQHSKVPGAERHDQVLLALVAAYQQGASSRETAGPLLFVSLYPGLTSVHQTALRWYRAEGDCAADLCLAFFERVSHWDLHRASGLAGRLQLDTLRALHRQRRREVSDLIRGTAAAAAAEASLDSGQSEEASASVFWALQAGDGLAYEPDEVEVQGARSWLATRGSLDADDVELAVLRLLCRLPWDTVAERLGMKPESARKRLQRALERLREDPDLADSCPGLEDRMCFSKVEGGEPGALH